MSSCLKRHGKETEREVWVWDKWMRGGEGRETKEQNETEEKRYYSHVVDKEASTTLCSENEA